MKFKVIKLGTKCQDKATKLDGTVTHWILGLSKLVTYLFQPKGLDDQGQPIKRIYLPLERLELGPDVFEEVEAPFEILGTIVTDEASGFTGMAVHFIRHMSGCFHVMIQPAGVVAKTGQPIDDRDFDLRGCIGEKIPVLTEAERKESQKDKPSPTGERVQIGLC